jgi:hypothetical protein
MTARGSRWSGTRDNGDYDKNPRCRGCCERRDAAGAFCTPGGRTARSVNANNDRCAFSSGRATSD